MFMTGGRLKAELARWEREGWVSPEGARRILADLDSRRSGIGLAGTLAVLGAVLMGFAAMSFVAANWNEMPKILRLGLIFGGIGGSYGVAHILFKKGLDLFGHAAVLTGVALFGAGIMLIAQMYHMDGNPPDAVWLWALGALVAGLLLRSNPALGAAVVLMTVWTWMTATQSTRLVHWGFLPMWAIAAAGIAQTRWRRGLDLLAISLSSWIVASTFQYDTRIGGTVLALIGIALSLTSVGAGHIIDQWRRISGAMLGYGMVLAYIGLFTLQFIPQGLASSSTPANLWLWAFVTLALIFGALWWAWKTQNRPALWIAYAAFSIEIFALYLKKIGTLLGTSLFFFLAGLLVIALAAVAYRLHKREQIAGGVS